MKKKHLVLIGGGHAHLVLLANLGLFAEKDIVVTVIQPSTHHYYSGMGAGMLGGTYAPEEIRFHTRQVVEGRGGRFVLGAAERIDPMKKKVFLEGGGDIEYDVLSCNAGSSVPLLFLPISGPNVFTVKPIEALQQARQRILDLGRSRRVRVVIVGGGPSAVEIAGNIHQLGAGAGIDPPEITVLAGRSLLPQAPAQVRKLAERSLTARGVTIRNSIRVREVRAGEVAAGDGQVYGADIVFLALGVKPSPIFARSGLPIGPDGGLRVNAMLQCTEQADIFGGGDCIHFEPQPLDKVGVYAVRENPVLFHNVLARLEEMPLRPFSPGGRYLLIYNLGGGYGICSKWGLAFGGRLAFVLKDFIDRRFMRTFQALER